MKYVLIAGWGRDTMETHDFCIGIHEDWYSAVGHAYDYLYNMCDSGYGGGLKNNNRDDEGKYHVEYIKDKHGRCVCIEDVVAISFPYKLEDEQGWIIWSEEKRHDDIDLSVWHGELESDACDNYIKILKYEERKEEE